MLPCSQQGQTDWGTTNAPTLSYKDVFGDEYKLSEYVFWEGLNKLK